jgi:hypothetical protein
VLKAIFCVLGAFIGLFIGIIEYSKTQIVSTGIAGLLGYWTGFAIVGAISGWLIASRMTSQKRD